MNTPTIYRSPDASDRPTRTAGGATVAGALSSLARTLALLALPAALIVGLHALGSAPPFRIDWTQPAAWLHGAPPADAVLAVARVAALAAAYRALVPALLYLVLRLLDAGRAAALLRPAVPRTLRPAIERLAALGGAAAIAASSAPALAMPAFPPLPAAATEDEGSVVSSPPGDVPTEPSETPPATTRPGVPIAPNQSSTSAGAVEPSARLSAHARDLPGAAAAPAEHVVRRGEHLWSIAAREVARRTGQAVDDLDAADITRYWRRVVAENRDRLRSGDPNLIHPGERIILPE